MDSKNTVSAVYRTFAVLNYLAEHRQAGVTEIAIATGIGKATASRFLNSLVETGMIRRLAGEDQYELTMGLFQLGAHALNRIDLPKLAHESMEKVARSTGETVHLAVYDEGQIVYTHKIDSSYTLQLVSRVGKRAPLHCTAIGKVLMADRSESFVEDVLQRQELTKFTNNTLTTVDAYQKHLKTVKDQGYAMDDEEHEIGVRCWAVPVYDHLDRVVAGVSVSIPAIRTLSIDEAALIETLKEAAQSISIAVSGAKTH